MYSGRETTSSSKIRDRNPTVYRIFLSGEVLNSRAIFDVESEIKARSPRHFSLFRKESEAISTCYIKFLTISSFFRLFFSTF